MYFKAVFDLNRPIETKVIDERSILEKMRVIPLFNNPPTPYADFEAALDLQDARIQAATFGGIDKTSAMRTQEAVVDKMVVGYREYVTIVAKGDRDIILSSGFRHTKERTPVGDMGKVINVKSKLTGISGEMDLRWKPINGKQFYEVEVRAMEVIPPRPVPPPEPTPTPEPPAGEAPLTEPVRETANEVLRHDWKMIATTAARITLTGLTPFVRHEVRIRAKGTSGYGEYSDTISFVVL